MIKVVLMIILVFLGGCTAQKNSISNLEPSTLAIDPTIPSYKLQEEEGVLIWYINYEWFPNTGLDQSLVAKKFLEDTGTQIHIMVGNNDRLNQMIAADQMPDIVTVDSTWQRQFIDSASQWAYPLNDLADAYDPYFYKVAKPEVIAWLTEEDSGKIYGYPKYAHTYDEYTQVIVGTENVFLVRQDIYENMGRPDMRTPEGFLQALRAVKVRYPDVIPLWIEWLAGDGGAAKDTLMNFLHIKEIRDGQYYERIYDPEYLRWIDILRIAYQENLISNDNFALSVYDYEELVNIGHFFAILSNGFGGTKQAIERNYNRDSNQHYLAIDGPANSRMEDPSFNTYGLMGQTLSFITKSSSNKERAIQFFTYLLSTEGYNAMAFGIEGESYFIDETDGLIRFTQKYIDWRNDDVDSYMKETRIGDYWMLQDDTVKLLTSDILPPKLQQIYHWMHGTSMPEYALEGTDPHPRSLEGKIWGNYQQERGATISRMIRSDTYEEMMNELELLKKMESSADFQKALAIKNQNIVKNINKLDRLGIKY